MLKIAYINNFRQFKVYVINHYTNIEGLTNRWTTACVERVFEKVKPEITLFKDKKINLYNPTMGSEVPLIKRYVQGTTWYVVQEVQNCSKQSATRSRIGEGPKKSIRRNLREFGIVRKMEIWGRRKIHSTKHIGKESSLISGLEDVLSGVYENSQLLELKEKALRHEKLVSLSKIIADPKFLIGCWIKIRSKKGALTSSFINETLDGIKLQWFVETANTIRNGAYQFAPARKTYILKSNGKKRHLTIPSPKDKIIQEAMRYLLEIIYEPRFLKCSHGWRSERGCHTALNDIKMTFGSINWFIEGDISEQFSSLDHTILVSFLNKDIKDQPFIDLVYKYLRVGYGEKLSAINSMHTGVIQGGILSPILANIYMHSLDEWVNNTLIKGFNKGERKRANPEYTKMIRSGSVKGRLIRPRLTLDKEYKRLRYVRYADDFLMGVIGSKKDCETIRAQLKQFLSDIKLGLNLEKTKITHAIRDSAKFLGYRIHITATKKQPIRKLKKADKQVTVRLIPRPILDAPIKEIVEKLVHRKYAKTNGTPTRNGRLIHLDLTSLIAHYKNLERGILTYYSYSSNYGRLAARIHYILKYSCALTIANKMKLKTLRRVFKKYGKDLIIKDESNKVVQNYPTCSYKKPKKKLNIDKKREVDFLIDDLANRIARGRTDLKGPCKLCGSEINIEIHHIKHLKKRNKNSDWLTRIMRQMNRKQIPVCQECHQNIHKGTANLKQKLGKFVDNLEKDR